MPENANMTLELNASLIDQVKEADPDRFRASLFAEPDARQKLAVLYAFHAELAKVPEYVSEPMLGEIRYQWWREVVEQIFSDAPVRQHEVSTPLNALVNARSLSRYRLDKLINARSRDLDPTPFTDIEDARTYCRETSGTLAVLAGECVSDSAPEDALMMAGEAWGMVGLARAWRFYNGTMLANVRFEEVVMAAQTTYKNAQNALDKMDAAIVPAIAYTALVPKFLMRLKSNAHDPKIQDVSFPVWRKQLRMMGCVLTGRV